MVGPLQRLQGLRRLPEGEIGASQHQPAVHVVGGLLHPRGKVLHQVIQGRLCLAVASRHGAAGRLEAGDDGVIAQLQVGEYGPQGQGDRQYQGQDRRPSSTGRGVCDGGSRVFGRLTIQVVQHLPLQVPAGRVVLFPVEDTGGQVGVQFRQAPAINQEVQLPLAGGAGRACAVQQRQGDEEDGQAHEPAGEYPEDDHLAGSFGSPTAALSVLRSRSIRAWSSVLRVSSGSLPWRRRARSSRKPPIPTRRKGPNHSR